MDTLQIVGKTLLVIFAFANVALVIYSNRNRLGFAWSIWKRVKVGVVLECIIVLVLTITSVLLLMAYVPIMDTGWSNLFLKHSENILFAPMTEALSSSNAYIRILAPTFLIVLIMTIPFMAHMEENLFRKGYHDWKQIIWQSIKFGFIHLVIGIPLACGVVLSGVGLFFAYKYKKTYEELEGKLSSSAQDEEAVLVSTTYHSVYNGLVISLLLFTALMQL